MEGFLRDVTTGSYMDMLTNAGYAVGRGSTTTGRIDPAVIDRRYYLTDGRIQGVIQQDIFRGLEQPTANRLYVVFVEPNVAVKLGADDSIRSFLGYHSSFVGYDAYGRMTNIYYAVIPYHGGINAQDNRVGVFDSMTETTSHELAEAVTDAIPGRGWYDYRLNGEIGDLTRGIVRLNGYVVQNVVDRNDRPISPAGSRPLAAGTSIGFAGTGGPGGFASGPRPLTGAPTRVWNVGAVGTLPVGGTCAIDVCGASALGHLFAGTAETTKPRAVGRDAAFARWGGR
jgi:hypothetical protein